jgi:hypothetical protein|tara:strand:- start:339 stop:947 length:609 start_codon:yes stop_codon:yes gene_type:complete
VRIFVIDTEYLTWNNINSIKNPLQRKKNEPPEIIQIFVKEIFTKFKNEKLIFIKPLHYKTYPHRISKLTSIKKLFLDTSGISFRLAYLDLYKLFPKNSLIISNGDESNIIEINIHLNKIKKKIKKLYFLDFNLLIKKHKLFEKYKKKIFITNNQIKNTLKIKNIISHDAQNDVNILIKCIKKISIKKKVIFKYRNFFKTYYL